ncbi:MAG TPA: hypothetical protein VF909_03685, partial [Roseiflexaceae bacterium]
MMQHNVDQQFTPSGDSRWTLQVDGFDPVLEPTIEAVFALVNGYQGTRAAVEEGSLVSRSATFIAGVFNTPDRPQTTELEQPIPEIVVAPDWSRLRIVVEGQELRLDQVELLGQRRVLDMRQGVLLREWRVRDGGGRVTSMRSLRFASLDNRHALVQLLMLMPENYSGHIVLESMVDGRVTNENNTLHLAPTEVAPIDDPSIPSTSSGSGSAPQRALLTMRTLQSGYELAFAAHADLRDAAGGEPARLLRELKFSTEGAIVHRWEWQAEQGHVYEMRKLVAVVTSRDTVEPAAEARHILNQLVAMGGAALLNAHTQAWAARWDAADAEIAGDA